jgi:hypothetical protein
MPAPISVWGAILLGEARSRLIPLALDMQEEAAVLA